MKILQPILFLSVLVIVALVRRKKTYLTKAFIRIGLLGIFLSITFAIFVPETFQSIAIMVGVGRGTDLLVYLTSLALFASSILIFVKIKEIEFRITRLVRDRAIEDADIT